MNRIISFPDDPGRGGSAASSARAATLPSVTCQRWCAAGNGHPGALRPAEQACVGVEQRIDAIHGGGTGEDGASVGFATLVSRAQQVPGQQPTFLIAIQTGDVEARIELTGGELGMFVEYAQVLLKQTTHPAV